MQIPPQIAFVIKFFESSEKWKFGMSMSLVIERPPFILPEERDLVPGH
jgi:hypothetical protein